MSPSLLRNIGPRPDALRARDNYRELAAGYDATCTHIEALRARAVRMLALSPGETVLDIACGTGAALPLLADAVGPSGRVIGVELSPEMAALARQRLAALLWGWPVNAFNLYRARRYLTTYANLDCPWRLLAERGASLRQAHSALWGSAYIAVGHMPLILNPPVTPGTE